MIGCFEAAAILVHWITKDHQNHIKVYDVSMKPIFRWAGSKRKLLPELRKNIPPTMNRYLEPFCGSACLYFDALPQKAILSDINFELIHAYKELQKDPRGINSSLETFSLDDEEYLRVRALIPSDLTSSERAARFIYLNRLCFNGVYRTNRKGQFNVPKGTKTGKIPSYDDLASFSEVLQNAAFLNGDFNECIRSATAGDFVYLDPPYSKPDSRYRGEYGPGSFNYLDLKRLTDDLRSLHSNGVDFILSYCQSNELTEHLCPSWHVKEIKVKRHVAGFSSKRNIVSEILVSNNELY